MMDGMTEQVEEGTVNKLMAQAMLLKAYKVFVTALDESGSVYSKQAQEAREFLEELRKDLE